MPVAPISHARGAARDALVAVEGRVTVPPGVFGRRVAYITDGTAGLRLQHFSRDLPALAEGDAVHVEGRLTTVYGEVTLNVAQIGRLGGGQPVAPVALAGGQMGAWWEGMLVRLAGRVQRWDADDIFLMTAPGRLKYPAAARLHRPERPDLTAGSPCRSLAWWGRAMGCGWSCRAGRATFRSYRRGCRPPASGVQSASRPFALVPCMPPCGKHPSREARRSNPPHRQHLR